MKPRSFFITGLAVLLFTASPACAAGIDLIGHHDHLGHVTNGQFGTIDNSISQGKNTLEGVAIGFLPADSEITFTYTFTGGAGSAGDLFGDAKYHEKSGPLTYKSFASTAGGDFSTVTDTGVHPHTIINVPSPILAAANMGAGDKTGTIVISNSSDEFVRFEVYFTDFFKSVCGKDGDVDVRYVVTSLDPASATPLPDSLFLFATALAVMILFRARTRLRPVPSSSPR